MEGRKTTTFYHIVITLADKHTYIISNDPAHSIFFAKWVQVYVCTSAIEMIQLDILMLVSVLMEMLLGSTLSVKKKSAKSD